jgi:hypothetical protein
MEQRDREHDDAARGCGNSERKADLRREGGQRDGADDAGGREERE